MCLEETRPSFITCKACGRVYFFRWQKCPSAHAGDKVSCACGAILHEIPQGDWDGHAFLEKGPTAQA